MGNFSNAPYRNATKISNRLLTLMMQAGKDAASLKAIALLAREWVNIEMMKREWRGVPRLASATMKEVLEHKRSLMKSAAPQEAFTEIEATTTQPTVTAPPTQMPP